MVTLEEFDEMTDSQQSQVTLSQVFPSAQSEQMQKGAPMNNNQHPMNYKEMLAKLLTMAKNQPAVYRTLNLIKTTASYEQNTKNLADSGKEDLKMTYGFLLGTHNKDPRVLIFKVDGLR